MGRRAIGAAVVAVAVLLTAARCTPGELSALKTSLGHGGGVSEGLLSDARAAKNLSGLSSEDRVLQRQLLARTDQRVLDIAVFAMDAKVATARTTVDATAVQTADDAILTDVKPQFLENLKDVTKDLVKEEACQAVLDQVSPPPDEPGEKRQWTDLVGEVIDRMVTKGWARPQGRWEQYIEWAGYGQGLAEDASQVTSGLLAGSTSIELFARPPVQRAAVAYARYCYATPRKP
jgi:hypothetical protein